MTCISKAWVGRWRNRARVRRPVGAGGLLLFEFEGPHLAYVSGINAQREIAVARRLIERGIPVDPSDVADADKPLAALLKAKV